jgi:Ca2+-dependent lipid-binding protein
VLQEALNLRVTDAFSAMQVYVAVKCGNNPVKSTCAQSVPRRNDIYPVTWYDGIDLEICTADEYITIQLCDYDLVGSDDVIGSVQLAVSEFYFSMEGDWSDTKHKKDMKKQLLFKGQAAGELKFSLFATLPGNLLPAMLPGMQTPEKVDDEQRPMINKLYTAMWKD